MGRWRAFKGSFFYELQLGPLVVQWKHSELVDGRQLRVWRDPFWR